MANYYNLAVDLSALQADVTLILDHVYTTRYTLFPNHATYVIASRAVMDAIKIVTDKVDPLLPASGELQSIKSDFNLSLAASDDLLQSNDAEVSHDTVTYTKKKEILVPYAGTYRVKFDLKSGRAGDAMLAKIYLGGVAHGTERSNNTETYQEFSEDLVFAADDLIQMYLKDEGSGWSSYVRNFRLYGVLSYGFVNNM